MPTKEASPEKRVRAVADESARLLADAVVQFTDQALDGRLKPITEGARDAAAKALKAAENVSNAHADLQDVLQTWNAGPPALKSFLERANVRLEQAERDSRDLVANAAVQAEAAMGEKLKPLLESVRSTEGKVGDAASVIDEASKEFASSLEALRRGPPALEAYLQRADERLEKQAGDQRTLVASTTQSLRDGLAGDMQPLMQSAAKAADRATDASVQLGAAAREFNAALEAMRSGPPSLAQFLVEAKADLARLSKPAASVYAELRVLSERIEDLEKTSKASVSQLTLGLGILAMAWVGLAGWAILRLQGG